MKAIILAAGMGTRLGSLLPKPLTALKNEKTILDFQIEKLINKIGLHNIILIVGYKHHVIMETHPKLMYIYNHKYIQTNTAKSLLYALNKIEDEDVLWMNGDVFFDELVLEKISNCENSACLVDNKNCGDEEVKYSLDERGLIQELSKEVEVAKGEALGINLIKAKDLEIFKKELENVGDGDYFEKALENLTLSKSIKLNAIDKENLFCQEIDFPEDLEVVRNYINNECRRTN
ncbi:phosphocholine cytidylyltransferase family protein [Candidatus Woesearchaeota archaeon]|nr:phosphocholine cytidylyltransferase family protein [Candidatus Woesearchaeota archaeon]